VSIYFDESAARIKVVASIWFRTASTLATTMISAI
jgi:hypothetical protein